MRSATARGGTRHTARIKGAPGKWDQTIYKHTHAAASHANAPRRPLPGGELSPRLACHVRATRAPAGPAAPAQP
ncbi:hypothetical protein GCM10022227_07480 [Streptomyces sedi]